MASAHGRYHHIFAEGIFFDPFSKGVGEDEVSLLGEVSRVPEPLRPELIPWSHGFLFQFIVPQKPPASRYYRCKRHLFIYKKDGFIQFHHRLEKHHVHITERKENVVENSSWDHT